MKPSVQAETAYLTVNPARLATPTRQACPYGSGNDDPPPLPRSINSLPPRIANLSFARDAQPRCTNGGGTPKRWMRSRMAANRSRGTATSASWNVTYLACRTTFAPILISFSRSVVNDQC